MRLAGYRLCWTTIALIFTMGMVQPILASDSGDHDRARQALEAGEILPLKTILEKVESAWPGQVMEVELERKGARWAYEIKLLRPGGSLMKLMVDASDGTIITRRGRDAPPERRQGE